MCLALLVVVVDTTILNTALPTLARVLGATTTDLQWITDSYTLVLAALLILAGAVGDRFGRRGALISGLAVFTAGSTAAALSHTTGELVAYRAVMGTGGAFAMPATLSIINGVFPRGERARAIAAWSAVAGLAAVVGPTLGGFLLAHFSWPSVFWVNVPLALVTLTAVAVVVPSVTTHRTGTVGRRRLDLVGAALSGLGTLALVDAVIEAPERGWTSLTTAGVVALGLAAFAGFVLRELRTPWPLIDVRVFAHRAFSAATVAVGLTFFAMFGSLFALTQYLQLVHGYSPLSAGLRALPFAAGVLVAAPAAPALVARLGVRVVIHAGLALVALGLFVLSGVSTTSGLVHVSAGVVLMGTGMGAVIAPASESIMSVLPEEQAGAGSALNDTVQEFGGSLGVAVIGSLVSAVYRHQLMLALDASTVTSPLPDAVTTGAGSSVAAANAIATQLGAQSPAAAATLTASAHVAFTTAMTHGFEVAAAVAAVGAVLAALALPARPTHRHSGSTWPGTPGPGGTGPGNGGPATTGSPTDVLTPVA